MNAHSKRISVFKILQAIGISTAGFVCAKFIDNVFLVISILALISKLIGEKIFIIIFILSIVSTIIGTGTIYTRYSKKTNIKLFKEC